jgi:hypothetical protein
LIPKGFEISPLPSEISYFLIQAMQTIQLTWIQSKRNPMSADGPPYVPKLDPGTNHFLVKLHDNEQELAVWSFLSLYRMARWSQAGALIGQRLRPMVLLTVQDSECNLAAAFQGNFEHSPFERSPFERSPFERSPFERSPFHIKGGAQLLPTVKTLLKAFSNGDPLPQCHQKAVTPKLLKKL